MTEIKLLEKLKTNKTLSKDEFLKLISSFKDEKVSEKAREMAVEVRKANYGNKVFTRGLIEISNYCKQDCLYCGIRKSNCNANRYRLSKEDILECCEKGYDIGFRTFVLQGGEDPFYTDQILTDIIKSIREKYNDCAITLSIGEREYDSYKKLYEAGANRFLLRHETANSNHYEKLHPIGMTLETRMNCLKNLKEIGFQTGCGFMVGSPNQTDENLAEDLVFISEFKPEMVGIGPFLPHHETPFGQEPAGDVDKTIFLLSLVRIMNPEILLPATTALGTASGDGRERGILAGANVVMPNLSPLSVRKKYMLYDNKISTGEEAAESWGKLKEKMNSIGYSLVVDRGDFVGDIIGKDSKNV